MCMRTSLLQRLNEYILSGTRRLSRLVSGNVLVLFRASATNLIGSFRNQPQISSSVKRGLAKVGVIKMILGSDGKTYNIYDTAGLGEYSGDTVDNLQSH